MGFFEYSVKIFFTRFTFSNKKSFILYFSKLTLKKIEINKLPFSDIHFFPMLPLPLVCSFETTTPKYFFLFLIKLMASSFVLFTLLNFTIFNFIDL